MGDLVYAAICSLDGYVEDVDGSFAWAEPDSEVHQYINDQERLFGTHLYGRRLYETMVYWETCDTSDQTPAIHRDFAQIWRAADKVVYSATLAEVSSDRTRLVREFNVAEVGALKESATEDLTIGGAELAGLAIRAGLVDELRMFVNPVSVGGGKPALPMNFQWKLRLVEERSFESGVVYLRYRSA